MTPKRKFVAISRPRDESLEAFKDWILEFFTAMTGREAAEDSISPERWIEKHREFWARSHGDAEQEGGANA